MKRFEDVWRDQCVAASGIKAKHGLVSALDYLVGEKLDTFAQTALTRPELARELPGVVGEIRQLFPRNEIAEYFATLEDDAKRANTSPKDKTLEASGLLMTQAEKKARIVRLGGLKAMLLAEQLGTA